MVEECWGKRSQDKIVINLGGILDIKAKLQGVFAKRHVD
jgi:hypothetical protein